MDYAILRTFTSYLDAHIVKGRLEAAGIPCWLKDEHLSALLVDPVFINAIAGIKIMVPADLLEKAEDILHNNDPDLTYNTEDEE